MIHHICHVRGELSLRLVLPRALARSKMLHTFGIEIFLWPIVYFCLCQKTKTKKTTKNKHLKVLQIRSVFTDMCKHTLHGCTPSSACIFGLLCVSSLCTARWPHLCSVCCQQLKHNPARTEGRNQSHIFRSICSLRIHCSPTVPHLDKPDAFLAKYCC